MLPVSAIRPPGTVMQRKSTMWALLGRPRATELPTRCEAEMPGLLWSAPHRRQELPMAYAPTRFAMTATTLRVLQLNIWKSREGMEALINDPHTRNLDILLIQEPSITTYGTHVNHSGWRLYQPTYIGGERKRSLLYVNRRISTSSHRQIRCNHRDITAVKMWTTDAQILIFSVYIPPVDLHRSTEEMSIQFTLDKIQSIIQQTIQGTDKPTRIVLAGDLNRHHPVWGNNQVHHLFMRQAAELINFFHTWKLQWCLPRGILTFWSMSHPGKTSTIDLTVTDSPERLIRCRLYHDHYGSDY
jgi:Endonuclease-reverse transcriptase